MVFTPSEIILYNSPGRVNTMSAAHVLTQMTIKTLGYMTIQGFKTQCAPRHLVKRTYEERKRCVNPRCCSGIYVPSVFQFIKVISCIISNGFFGYLICRMTTHTGSFIFPHFSLECASIFNTDFSSSASQSYAHCPGKHS